MPKYTVPGDKEREIIRQNGIDPDSVIVSLRTKDSIHLLVFKTRDTIIIHRGDRPNDKEREIIRQNGIDPDSVTVSFRTKDSIHLLVFKTRDTIIIHRGDRPWL